MLSRTLQGSIVVLAIGLLLPADGYAQRTGDSVRFRIIFTANDLGYVEPCDCSGEHQGGLDRRSVAVKRAREEGRPTVLVDLGNLFELPGRSPTTELGNRQAAFLVNEMNELGYRLQGIGAKEMIYNPRFLERYLVDLKATLLLTNRAEGADLALTTVPVHRVAIDGLSVDFFCIIDPEMVRREGMLIPFEEPLRSELNRSANGEDPADLQVVISHLPIGFSDRLPEHFPEIDLILDGTLILPRQAFRTGDHTVMMSTAGKGQQVGILNLTVWKREHRPVGVPAILGFQGLQVPLPMEYPTDAEVAGRIEAFRQQLIKDGLIPPSVP
jgi:2',3'-cyclic-nucleotide 2'-phosphodiesterase (5'-nucleotidase family)